MYSKRFSSIIRLTHHAVKRMAERNVSDNLLIDLIESGTVKEKDDSHFWIFKAYPDRNDNLLCVVVV